MWDVHPEVRERRSGQDRRAEAARGPAEERRQKPDRRRTLGHRWSGLPTALVSGWLVFAAGPLQRRLMPIPSSWEVFDDHELSRLCETAQPVLRKG